MKRILLISEKAPPYTRWSKTLTQHGFKTEIFADLSKALDHILFKVPDMLIIEEKLNPDLVKDLVFALKGDLHLSSLPVLLVLPPEKIGEIEWEDYLVDDFWSEGSSEEEVLSRVHLAFVRAAHSADTNPLTGLPGNTSILKKIEEVLKAKEPYAVGYIDIDRFKPFNDAYGFSRGDEIIRMLARVVVHTIDELCGNKGFVGHIGGDDFVFICPLEQAEEVARRVIQKFDELILKFIDPEDRERGCLITTDRQGVLCRIPWPSISIAIVPVWKERFKHYGEVATVAAQLKKYVKSMPGSSYLIDRRKERRP